VVPKVDGDQNRSLLLLEPNPEIFLTKRFESSWFLHWGKIPMLLNQFSVGTHGGPNVFTRRFVWDWTLLKVFLPPNGGTFPPFLGGVSAIVLF